MRILSRSPHALLIQTVALNIPAYAMQMTKLPSTSISTMKKLCREFLWGDNLEKRTMHLVSWEMVCKAKKNGGLEIRQFQHTSTVALARLYWRLLSNPTALLCHLLRGKYGDL